MPAVAPPAVTREEFLRAVRTVGVASDRACEKALAALPPGTCPREASHHFVQAGVLTRYQADRLLAGKTEGFRLGRYLILEPLGGGPGGHTFKARHDTMNRVVAVTVLSPERTGNRAAREKFHTDARAAAQLAHPNVATVLDANESGDRVYVVTEYMDGASLERVVRDFGPRPVAEACDAVMQAAHGLAHAHEKKLPHGKLNPTTVLVGRPPAGGKAMVKVTNFGTFAASPTGLTKDAEAVEYLPPEQFAAGAGPTPAGDAFALGCVLYFLLAGKPPEPVGGDAILHQFDAPVPLAELRGDVPPTVLRIVADLMAHDPAARPSCAAAAVALAPFAQDAVGLVEFPMPPTAGPNSSGGHMLAGLLTADPDPFANMVGDGGDDFPTYDNARQHTPVSLRRPPPRKKPAPSVWPVLLIAGVVLLATAAAAAWAVRTFK